MSATEANFDGLVGPTHNYSGLAFGNLAALSHAGAVSNPREAALQGLEKMATLHALGVPQGVLPPHERPHLPTLRRLGFGGSDRQILDRAARQAPQLLAMCSSASGMWTANAATVSPSADTADGRVHFTTANLCSQLHRAIEAEQSERTLRTVFADRHRFCHHGPLPAVPDLGDEGAANHVRLSAAAGEPGVELFVYGRAAQQARAPRRFPARQTCAASEAVARLHALDAARVIFVQQHPAAIDAGVFHNDVIALGHDNVFLYHEQAFADADALRRAVNAKLPAVHWLAVRRDQVSLDDAVRSYLFNSQLVTRADGTFHLIVPAECEALPAVARYLRELMAADNPIRGVSALDLRQSMHNGGGPACLRLRVELTAEERDGVTPGVWFSERLHGRLRRWVQRHYRDRLYPADLADPALLDESRAALDELTRILGLGSIYPFQRTDNGRKQHDEH